MDWNEKLAISIDSKKSILQQLDTLSQYDKISDQEIQEIAETCFKSSEAGILIEYLGPKRLEKFFPLFLEFLQDINWPASRGVSVMLVSAGESLIPELIRVFREINDDKIWHYWILTIIVRKFERDLVLKLKPTLLALIEKADKEGAAIEALVRLKSNDLLTEEEIKNCFQYLANCYNEDELWLKELTSEMNLS